MALAAWVVTAVCWYVLDAAGLSEELSTALTTAVGWFLYFVLAGAVTATIGGRLRETLGRVAATSVFASILPIVLFIVFKPALSLVFLPFALPIVVLAPVMAGAGDAWFLRGVWASARLVAQGNWMRSAAVASGALLIGIVLWVGLSVAFSSLSPAGQALVVTALWSVVYGPVSSLVYRSLYGALTGRMVVTRPERPETP